MSPYPVILFLFGVAIGISPWITNIIDSYGKGVTQKTKRENSRSSEKFVHIQNLDKISGQTPSIKNLEAFLLEYSKLPPEEAGKKLFELAQHPDSDFNRYPVLFFWPVSGDKPRRRKPANSSPCRKTTQNTIL